MNRPGEPMVWDPRSNLERLSDLCAEMWPEDVERVLRFAAYVLRNKYGSNNGAARTLDFYAERVKEEDFDE